MQVRRAKAALGRGMTHAAVAELVGVTSWQIRKAVAAGALPRVGSGRWKRDDPSRPRRKPRRWMDDESDLADLTEAQVLEEAAKIRAAWTEGEWLNR
jgi:hypothetical protein